MKDEDVSLAKTNSEFAYLDNHVKIYKNNEHYVTFVLKIRSNGTSNAVYFYADLFKNTGAGIFTTERHFY